MLYRKIYNDLETHLKKEQITVITGMRRVGKTTTVKHLLFKVDHNNKVYFDLERIENRYLFNQDNYKEIAIGIEVEGVDLNEKAVIALDEVQLVSGITSVIKYLYDTYSIKFILTGSSSFYIKNRFSESLAGRKKIFEMFPLGFQEFINFKGEDANALEKFRFQSFNPRFYQKYKVLYEEYLQFGGFPEVVLSENKQDKIDYIEDIVNAYIELDIKLISDFAVSNDLYKLIKLIAGRVGSRIDFSKLSSIVGISREKVKEYFQLFEYTYLIYVLRPFTKNIDKEISRQQKLYFADTGILNYFSKISGGQLFENGVACQLKQLGKINYYQKKSGQEIDFILNEKNGFEVKETPALPDKQNLEKKAAQLELDKSYLIGRTPLQNNFKDFIWGGNIF